MCNAKAELALWHAVIHQAAREGLKYKGGKQRIYGEAYHWFKDNHAQFRFVCELADLEPDAVRAWFVKAYEARHPKYKTPHLECVCEELLCEYSLERPIEKPIENPILESSMKDLIIEESSVGSTKEQPVESPSITNIDIFTQDTLEGEPS